MNRLLVILGISCALIAGAVAAQTTHALDFIVTEEHEQRIRQNCVAAQATLYQLHASDALLRNNRGTLYENISNKLMAPLNGRIALHRHQGLKMAATTIEYDRQIDIFRADYIEYERAMSSTLNMKCAEKPVEFYASVLSTREKRLRLHEDTKTINTLLGAYKVEFEEFALEFKGGGAE